MARTTLVIERHDEAHDLRRLFSAERSRLLTLAAGVEAAAARAYQLGDDAGAAELRELARVAMEGRR